MLKTLIFVPLLAVISACADSESALTVTSRQLVGSAASYRFEEMVPPSSPGAFGSSDSDHFGAMAGLSVMVWEATGATIYKLKITGQAKNALLNSGGEIALTSREYDDLLLGKAVVPSTSSFIRYPVGAGFVTRSVDGLSFVSRPDRSQGLDFILGEPFCRDGEERSTCSSDLSATTTAWYIGLIGTACEIVSERGVFVDLEYSSPLCNSAVQRILAANRPQQETILEVRK